MKMWKSYGNTIFETDRIGIEFHLNMYSRKLHDKQQLCPIRQSSNVFVSTLTSCTAYNACYIRSYDWGRTECKQK